MDQTNLIIKTAKLLPYLKRSKALPGFATAYDFEPEPSQAQVLGNLLVVIEVLAVPKQAEAVADLVIQTLGNTFYHAPNSEDIPPVYQRFELAVKAVNHELAEYADRGHAGWVGRLSAVLAVQTAEQLHITQAGSANGYLYRHGKVTHITAEMSALGPHRPQTSFSSIASGKLEAEDRILLATPALFHQVDRSRLSEVVSENGPETAVTKLSELVNQNNHADRVAALIIDVTTPELMAMQRGSADHTEVKVGRPDTLIDTAKEAAAPVVAESLQVAKRAGETVVRHSRQTVLPKAKSLAISAVHNLSQVARHPKQRRWLWGAAAVVIVLAGWLVYQSSNSKAIDGLASRYKHDYSLATTARAQITAGDKTTARQQLVIAQADLDQLAHLPQSSLIDRRLSHTARPEGDPGSISSLKTQINTLIDQIDGLVTVSPQELTGFDTLKNARPSKLEIVATKLVLIDPATSNLTLFDPTSNQLGAPVTSPGLGKIIASTASSNDDGVYLLTDEPAVWFFKLDGTLTKQVVTFGDWPKSRAIASYAGNLYLLADDSSQIYKHTRSLGGFAGKANYLSADTVPTIIGSTSLIVDGSVYTGGSYGLKRFLSGKLSSSVTLPDTFTHPTSLNSTSGGDLILVSDSQSGRLAEVASGGNLSFTKQITLTNSTKLLDAKADTKAKTAYGLTATKLVKFALPQ